MKCSSLTGALIVLSAATFCSAVEFDRGGTIMDFQAISAARMQKSNAGAENLFGKWIPGTVWMHSARKEAQALLPKAKPYVKFEQKKTDNGIVLKTIKPIEMEKAAGEYSVNISASWLQKITLPDAKGGEYVLSFRSKGYALGKSSSSMVVIATKTAKGYGNNIVKVFPLTKAFHDNIYSISFPAGVIGADVYLRLNGCGELEIENPVLSRKVVDYPVEATLFPNGILDQTFVLTQNDPSVIAFVLKRNVPVSALNVKSPVLKVKLPPEVEFLEAPPPLKFLRKEGNVHYFDASHWNHRLRRYDGYEPYMKLALLVTTKSPVGVCAEPAEFCLVDGEKIISKPAQFRVRIEPQIPAVKQSSLFYTGYQPMGLYLNFKKNTSRELFASFSGKTGFRWITFNFDNEAVPYYRKHGTELITPELYWLSNGYRICEKKPDYAKFKPIGKSKSFDVNNATCPAAIYNKTGFYKDYLLPYLKESLAGKDGVIANWEPYMFHGQGCFCDTCRDEFAVYMKMSQEQVKKIWPKELTINGKYHAQGVRFRSLQHAKMIKVIQEAVNQATTGKAGFVPEVVWITCAETTERESGSSAEHDPMDYADSLTYIDPWGPYTGWKALETYHYEKAENLNTYVAAKKVSSFMKKRFGKKCPRLVALPHGLQGHFWVTSPEGMAMEVTGFFVQGFRAALLYLFPQGYDNRYWSVLARNNDLIATHEDIVFNGKNITEQVAVSPVTPYPAPKKRIMPRYLPRHPAETLLQYEAFRKGDTVMVATGNYWTRGDVFYRLKVSGLKSNARYAVTETALDRTYTADNGKSFTGAELQKGILLHAGALRWSFIRIEPAGKIPAAAVKVTQKDIKNAIPRHLPAIQKAAAADAKLDAKEDAEYQKAELRTLKNGPLNCTAATSAGDSQSLRFVSGKNSLLLEVSSCVIRSWNVNGRELVGGFGIPIFWKPASSVSAQYRMTKQDVTPEGMTVTMERLFTRKNDAALEHLLVKHTVNVSKDLEKVTMKTELIDGHNSETGGGGFTLGFRYQCFPANIGNNGKIAMTSGGKEYIYSRNMKRNLFSVGMTESAKIMKKLFECVDGPVLIDNSRVRLQFADKGPVVSLKATPEKLFAGYAVWDAPDLKFPTFEPFFHPVSVSPGKPMEFSIELKVEK